MRITEENWDNTCPHCDALATLDYIEKGRLAGMHYVECPSCGMRSPAVMDPDEACRLWDEMTFRTVERKRLREIHAENDLYMQTR